MRVSDHAADGIASVMNWTPLSDEGFDCSTVCFALLCVVVSAAMFLMRGTDASRFFDSAVGFNRLILRGDATPISVYEYDMIRYMI